MQHFKKLTIGRYATHGGCNNVVLVGSTTFEQCLNAKDLPDRKMLIVGKDYMSLPDAVAEAFYTEYEEIVDSWVIGGATIYKQLINICDEVHISHIDNNDKGDTTFELPSDYRGKVFHYNFEEDGRDTKDTTETQGYITML